MTARDSGIRAHQEWLGLIQPVGLVVSPAALVNAQVELDPSLRAKWLEYDSLLTEQNSERVLTDWRALVETFLEWTPANGVELIGAADLPDDLRVVLPDYNDRIDPHAAVRDPAGFALLVRHEMGDVPLDKPSDANGWTASPHDRFEKLLRDTQVHTGLLFTERTIRLVHAPKGESSGYLTFPVETMSAPHGRPMLMALYELLKGYRFSAASPSDRRLRDILAYSRRYQNEVSAELAEQVLGALYDLTRGFQEADDRGRGTVVQDTLSNASGDVYGGLLTTVMRLVFVLYAEERGMLPQDGTWVEHYGIGSLFERLRADKARYPDQMQQRFAAWPRLLSLFRILHDGAHADRFRVPARAGELFDPDRYPFLEGRPWGSRRVMGERLRGVPRLSDDTILRVLERLLMLDEERLSYRALDVEQIGSVYEAMMGFEIRRATGTSIAVKPKTSKGGSPSHQVVDLEQLLKVKGSDRAKWLKEQAECELPPADADKLKEAASVADALAAIARRRSPFTPHPAALGAMVLHPTEERRRSGSHYTPRELTEPMVETTLRPVFEGMGGAPTADQILELNVCDPAMGSGAFLVGACRYLSERLVDAWQRTGQMPRDIPPDEDAPLYARRLVAQRCLFGVDRNPYAVQLAKLSLWLVTLARDHPFTFLDHALKAGDSLVGLTRAQIMALDWAVTVVRAKQIDTLGDDIRKRVELAAGRRDSIEALAATDDTREKQRLLGESDNALRFVRLAGDAVVAAFFANSRDRERKLERGRNQEIIRGSIATMLDGSRLEETAKKLQAKEPPVTPFHWEIEFPEVFDGDNPGFHAIIGNPPFAGKNTLINANPEHYLDWLQTIHEGAHGNSDLVAHFFRRAYGLLRKGGAYGLIATNTIAQGDTRATGLRWLRTHGCTLYDARRRYKWPGAAAVVVSRVHGLRGGYAGPSLLDGREVERITAFLFHAGGDDDPAPLPENAGRSFQGSIVLGMGFTFDDTNDEATPIAEMERLIAENPKNAEVIFPYIGGEEVNDSPTHAHRRYVINFGDMSEEEARRGWPELMGIVETKVKPQRLAQRDEYGRTHWWQFLRTRPEMREAVAGLERVLVVARVGQAMAFAFLPPATVFSEQLVVIALSTSAAMTVLQSRIHELWARFFGSSMKDDLRYTPSDCFETFPFPDNWESNPDLERAGQAYHDYRAQLMVANDHGPRGARCLRLDRSRPRVRLLPRAQRRGRGGRGVRAEEEALSLPLARRHPRRSPGPAPRAQQAPRRAVGERPQNPSLRTNERQRVQIRSPGSF